VAIAVAGYRAEFSRRLKLDKVKREIVTTLGRFGFVARAVVCAMIGCFLVFAALHSHSSEAKGFAGALRFIQQQPYGSVLLGITALGLLAFGVCGVAEGVYRRVDAPKPARRRKASRSCTDYPKAIRRRAPASPARGRCWRFY
jgi:hypothetical protein